MKKLLPLFSLSILFISGWANASLISGLGEVNSSFYTNDNTDAGWLRGWVFKVNIEDVWVSQLGLHTPSADASEFTINLWDLTSNSVIASTRANDSSDGWEWFDIAPVALLNGNEYFVSLFSPTDAPYYYSYEQSTMPDGDIKYIEARYCNDCSSDTNPTGITDYLNTGLVDIAYQVIPSSSNPIPEPSTLLLLTLGLGFISRRQRHH